MVLDQTRLDKLTRLDNAHNEPRRSEIYKSSLYNSVFYFFGDGI